MGAGAQRGGEPQTFVEHLTELRRRLVVSLLAVAVMFVVAWFFRHDILIILKQPLLDALPESARHTVLLRVMDKFMVHIKLALYGALFLASPIVLHQAWAFVSPGLYRHERRIVAPFVLLATILFFGGAAFCYFVVMPYGFQFFVLYSVSGEPLGAAALTQAPDLLQISLKEHIEFTARFMLAFGVAFETPLFMIALSAMGVVPPDRFAKARPYAVVAIFVLAAVLTPPDPWTQVCLGVPLAILYEGGIWAGRLMVALRRKRSQERDDAEAAADSSIHREG